MFVKYMYVKVLYRKSGEMGEDETTCTNKSPMNKNLSLQNLAYFTYIRYSSCRNMK